jgi:Domain of unknown function (DUF4126)
MSALETLGFTVGTAFASGLNLYATVGVLGLLERFHAIQLPESLHIVAHPAVIVTATAFYVLEFVADKVPYVDTIWDAIHTFIRPPAAGLLAYAAFGNVPEVWRVMGGLLAGGVALTSHGTKASARAAINTSPEPFSNWVASLSEDGIAVFLVWMAAKHPVLAMVLVAVLLTMCGYLLLKLSKFLKQVLSRFLARPQPTME